MPQWVMTPLGGGEAHVCLTSRGKRPADEGYDESRFTVRRLKRAMRANERVIDQQVRVCPQLAETSARQSRIAAVGFDAWLEERVTELVAVQLAAAGLTPVKSESAL